MLEPAPKRRRDSLWCPSCSGLQAGRRLGEQQRAHRSSPSTGKEIRREGVEGDGVSGDIHVSPTDRCALYDSIRSPRSLCSLHSTPVSNKKHQAARNGSRRVFEAGTT